MAQTEGMAPITGMEETVEMLAMEATVMVVMVVKGVPTVLMTAKTVKMADILFAMPFVSSRQLSQTLQLSAQAHYQQIKVTSPASWHKPDLRPR